MLLYALTFVNSKSDTEDIVQEVFYNFWKSEAYLRVPIDEARPWLLRAIKNACINFWEKKDVLRSSAELHNITIEDEEYSEFNEQIFTQIRQDIENMPPQTREKPYSTKKKSIRKLPTTSASPSIPSKHCSVGPSGNLENATRIISVFSCTCF